MRRSRTSDARSNALSSPEIRGSETDQWICDGVPWATSISYALSHTVITKSVGRYLGDGLGRAPRSLRPRRDAALSVPG